MKKLLFFIILLFVFACEKEQESEPQIEMVCWECTWLWFSGPVVKTYCTNEQLNMGRTGVITEDDIRLFEQLKSTRPEIVTVTCKEKN